ADVNAVDLQAKVDEWFHAASRAAADVERTHDAWRFRHCREHTVEVMLVRLVCPLENINKSVSLLRRRSLARQRVVAVRQLLSVAQRIDPPVVRVAELSQVFRLTAIESQSGDRSLKRFAQAIDGDRVATEILPSLQGNRGAIGDRTFETGA